MLTTNEKEDELLYIAWFKIGLMASIELIIKTVSHDSCSNLSSFSIKVASGPSWASGWRKGWERIPHIKTDSYIQIWHLTLWFSNWKYQLYFIFFWILFSGDMKMYFIYCKNYKIRTSFLPILHFWVFQNTQRKEWIWIWIKQIRISPSLFLLLSLSL